MTAGREGWRTQKWGGDGVFEYAQTGHTGEHSVMIASEKGGDIGWGTTVAVEPFARYRLSGWIKTENVQAKDSRGALFNLHNLQPVATRALTGTNDWTRVEVVFETEEQDAIQVNCLFGGWGLATGKAWYDDVVLGTAVPLAAAAAEHRDRRGQDGRADLASTSTASSSSTWAAASTAGSGPKCCRTANSSIRSEPRIRLGSRSDRPMR